MVFVKFYFLSYHFIHIDSALDDFEKRMKTNKNLEDQRDSTSSEDDQPKTKKF